MVAEEPPVDLPQLTEEQPAETLHGTDGPSPEVRNVVSCSMKSGMWIVITPAASTDPSSTPGSRWPSKTRT